jgi:hypothetical protein
MNRACAAAWLALALFAATAGADPVEEGRRIYEEGLLPSGRPLTGVRFDNVTLTGAQVACINCHRRSGLGSVEGDTQVPPITGRFLFADGGDRALAAMDRRSGRSMNQRHDPYTKAGFATAVRAGINNHGRAMETVMPRFDLNDAELHALTAYLRQLSAQWSPGVTDRTIRFATVIAPGVAPARREALLATLRTAFAQKNGSTITARAGGRRHMVSAAEMILGTERTWLLDVWELRGAPETWGEQLDAFYRRAPVFALVSGISDSTWEPVHDFCESRRVPCWFPSVPLPGTTPGGYALYFSRGVMLEAEVLASQLAAGGAARVVQIRRDDAPAREAAASLRRLLGASATEERVVTDEPGSLAAALAQLRPGDAVVFWLQPDALAPLAGITPPPGITACFSGQLTSADPAAIPRNWRAVAHLAYPYELPPKREAHMEYFRAWLATRRLPLVDEPLQAEAWFAADYLASTVGSMLDNLHRDYLLERAQDMLGSSEAGKAEEQTRMVLPRGPATNRPRAGTTVYPRLSLGPGQSFASKGAWIVGFDGADHLVPESEWIVP